MATARKGAGDFTGRQTEKLVAENKDELVKRAQEISIMAEVQAEENAKPVDYTQGPSTKQVQDDLEMHEVALEEPTRSVTLNTTLESMTFGAGQHYNFEAGKKYVVPSDMARHLKEKGYIWDGSYH